MKIRQLYLFVLILSMILGVAAQGSDRIGGNELRGSEQGGAELIGGENRSNAVEGSGKITGNFSSKASIITDTFTKKIGGFVSGSIESIRNLIFSLDTDNSDNNLGEGNITGGAGIQS